MSITVDDSSPELWYVGASWLTDHKDDGQTNLYSNATFHTSTKDGDYVQIKWKGTDIIVYGSRRDNHGVYGVALDGGAVQYYSGYSSTSQFQQALYATEGLQNGVHTLQLINSNSRNVAQYPNYLWLDIDYVSFTGTILNADPNAKAAPVVPSSASQTPQPPPPSSTPSVISPSPTPSPSTTITSLSSITILTTPSTTPSSSSTTTSSILSSSRPSSDISTGLIPHFSTPSSIPTSPGSYPPTGSPAIPPSSEVVSNSPAQKTDHKTTTIGVSVTIIVVALVISAAIVGGWWWRRRKRQREEEEDTGDYLAPQSSWR